MSIQSNPVEKDWKKPRYSLTTNLWYDEAMPKLPQWTKKDLHDFIVANPREGEQFAWLSWRNRIKMYATFAAGTAFAAVGLVRKRHPAYAVVGFTFGSILGFLYGDDLPHAYQRTVFGSIDAKRVNNSFLSWWRQTQHERYYAANPSQRPGATPVAASSAAATAGKDAKAGGKLQAKH